MASFCCASVLWYTLTPSCYLWLLLSYFIKMKPFTRRIEEYLNSRNRFTNIFTKQRHKNSHISMTNTNGFRNRKCIIYAKKISIKKKYHYQSSVSMVYENYTYDTIFSILYNKYKNYPFKYICIGIAIHCIHRNKFI